MSDEGPLRSGPDDRGPIFIIGAMGSGTTLLRLILDSHPNIAIPHETGFMRAYKSTVFIPFKWTGRNWAQRLGWSKEEFDHELAVFFDRIFMRYAEQHGKNRWGEKTPLHTWHITAMARLYPNARFVAMVRHPGASTVSNMRRFKHRVQRMVRHYDRYNKEIARQALAYPDSMVLLRYEDLVTQPERTIRELLDWLGEPWSDSVMQHHVVQTERGHGRVEGQSSAGDPIDPSRIAAWKQKSTQDTRRVIRRRIGRLGEFFGYSMKEPEKLQPLHDRESVLVTGRDLEPRVEEFADLNIRERGPVPHADHYYSPRKFFLVPNETGEPRGWVVAPEAPLVGVRRLVQPVTSRLPHKTRRRLRKTARKVLGPARRTVPGKQ